MLCTNLLEYSNCIKLKLKMVLVVFVAAQSIWGCCLSFRWIEYTSAANQISRTVLYKRFSLQPTSHKYSAGKFLFLLLL